MIENDIVNRSASPDCARLPSSVHIAVPSDFTSILYLNRLLDDRDSADPARIVERIRSQGYFVCCEGSTILAAMSLTLMDARTALIETIVTKPEMRKLGFGRMLVDFAAEWGRDQKARALWVESDVRYAAGPFYRKCGFMQEQSLETYLMGDTYLRFIKKL